MNKKIMIVAPDFLEWDLGTYLKSLISENGTERCTFAYSPANYKTDKEANRQLLKAAKSYRPDIILGLKLDRIEANTLEKLKKDGAFIALWYVDCFTEEVPGWMKPLAKAADVFLTTAKGMVNKYEALTSAPVYWVYEGAYLPAFPGMKLPDSSNRTYASAVSFIGTVFQPPVADKEIALRRFELFKKIGHKYELKVWGVQGGPVMKRLASSNYRVIEWPAYNEDVVKICQASDIILGINTVNSVELYFSNRTFLTLASGGFHLTHYVPGLEEMFKNHKHLVWYNSDEECLDLIGYYLKRPVKRRMIAKEGQAWTRRRYSMKRQLNKIFEIIKRHY